MSDVVYLLHGHHEGLITFGRGYDERREEILSEKPQAEHELRLVRMRVLTVDEMAELPPRRAESVRLGAEGIRLWAESDRLRAERVRLWAERDRLWAESDRLERDALIAWHAKVCVPACKATPENNWNIFGEDQR
jgi:hypothetical protein